MTDRSEYEINKLKDDVLKVGRERARECGLDAHYSQICLYDTPIYFASDIHRLLGAAQLYHFVKNELSSPDMRTVLPTFYKASHTALLIGIKPLHVESEERQLLKELVDLASESKIGPLDRLCERAKRLLEGER